MFQKKASRPVLEMIGQQCNGAIMHSQVSSSKIQHMMNNPVWHCLLSLVPERPLKGGDLAPRWRWWMVVRDQVI